MEKDDIILGRVRMNPIDNEMCPCIKIIMCDGLAEGELVLLKVIESEFDSEMNELERENSKLKDKIKELKSKVKVKNG